MARLGGTHGVWLALLLAVASVLVLPPSAARAASFVIVDAASCAALPVATIWTESSKTCRIGANLTIPAGDTLEVASTADLAIPSGVTLANAGTLTNRGALLQSGTLTNTGIVDNRGFWDLRGGATFRNESAGALTTSNQIQIVGATFQNLGFMSATQSVRVSPPSTFTNAGFLVNGAVLVNEGTFVNSGAVANDNRFRNQCGTFTNTGTFSGSPIEDVFCTRSGGTWTDPTSWNQAAVPGSGDEVIIRHDIHVSSVVVRTGVTSLLADLIVDAAGTLQNDGRLFIGNGGQYPGTFVFVVNGAAINNGDIDNLDTIRVAGLFTNHGGIDRDYGTGMIENSGTLLNATGAVIEGGLDNKAGGRFQIDGRLDLNRTLNTNSGLIQVRAGGSLNIQNGLVNKSGGRIDVGGLLTINDALTNPGYLTNESGGIAYVMSGGTVQVTAADARWQNAGNTEHRGAISNSGAIANTGSFCGTGTLTGNPITGTAAVASCAPRLDLGADASLLEGGTATVGAQFLDPGIPNTYTALVEWGDGGTTTPAVNANGTLRGFSSSHVYADDGVYVVLATVCDETGACVDDTAIRVVQNVAPTVTLGGPATIGEGSPATFTFSISDPGADTFSVTAADIDCGAGGTVVPASFAFAGAAGSFGCRYADGPSTATARATAVDDDGGSGTGTRGVSVTNVPPTVDAVTLAAGPFALGATVSASAAFSDPGAESSFTALWEWGDGTTSAGAVDLATRTASGSHTYAAAGLYQVGVTISDDDGGAGTGHANDLVVVYDPDTFFSGSGAYESPAGAFADDPARTGTFSFFASPRYLLGATTPTGRLELRSGSTLVFQATDLSWLVVSEPLAFLSGSGRFAGSPGFDFVMTIHDGQAAGGDGVDRMRMRVWDRASGAVVYDTQPGAAMNASPALGLARGSLTIRRL